MQSHTASNTSFSTATETVSQATAVDPWEEGSSRSAHDDADDEDSKSESASALSNISRSPADTSKPTQPVRPPLRSFHFPGHGSEKSGAVNGSRKRSAPQSSSSASWNQSSNNDQSTKTPESAASITNASSQRKSMMRDFYFANSHCQTEDLRYTAPRLPASDTKHSGESKSVYSTAVLELAAKHAKAYYSRQGSSKRQDVRQGWTYGGRKRVVK